MSNPNQEIIESRLATYIDGELDASERLEIEQHLQQNPQYRKVIDDLRKQRDMLRGLPREAAPLDLAEAFTNQLERSELLDAGVRKDSAPIRMYAFPRMLATAAIVLLTVGLAAVVYYVLPDRNTRKVAVVDTPPKSSTTYPSGKTDDGSIEGGPAEVATGSPNTASNLKSTADEAAGNTAAAPSPLAPAAAVAPGPEVSAKPSAMIAAKHSALAEGLGAANDRGNRRLERTRDAQLDQLARSVSSDPQVKALFANNADNVADGAAMASSQNARVLVVRSKNPRQLESDLTKFFGKGSISWKPVPSKVELALNTTLSQQEGEALEGNAVPNKREIDPEAVEGMREPLNKEKQSAFNHVGEPAPATRPSSAKAGAELELANVAGRNGQPQLQDASPTPTGGEAAKGATSRAAGIPATPLATTQVAGAVEFYRQDLRKSVASAPDNRGTLATNAAPVENMYVVRRLSHKQVEELNVYLAQGGEARADEDYRRLGEYRFSEDSLVAAGPAIPPAASAPMPTTNAPGAIPGAVASGARPSGSDAALRDGPGTQNNLPAAAGQGVGQTASADKRQTTTAFDAVVRKGDSLRLRYKPASAAKDAAEESQTVKVQEDGTIALAGRPVHVAGKTLSEVEHELTNSPIEQSGTGAGTGAATQQAVTVERLASVTPAANSARDASAQAELKKAEAIATTQFGQTRDELQPRRAMGRAAVSPSTTQPALGSDDPSQGVVDVVIVIQKQADSTNTIAAPFVPAGPAPTPTTAPALAAAKPPTTSPSTTRPASAK